MSVSSRTTVLVHWTWNITLDKVTDDSPLLVFLASLPGVVFENHPRSSRSLRHSSMPTIVSHKGARCVWCCLTVLLRLLSPLTLVSLLDRFSRLKLLAIVMVRTKIDTFSVSKQLFCLFCFLHRNSLSVSRRDGAATTHQGTCRHHGLFCSRLLEKNGCALQTT